MSSDHDITHTTHTHTHTHTQESEREEGTEGTEGSEVNELTDSSVDGPECVQSSVHSGEERGDNVVQSGHLCVEQVLVGEPGSEGRLGGPVRYTRLHRLVHNPGRGEKEGGRGRVRVRGRGRQ